MPSNPTEATLPGTSRPEASTKRPRSFFFHPEEGRLRVGWRIALFVVLLAGLATVVSMILRAVPLPEDRDLRMALLVAMAATVGTTAVLIARRFLDKRPLRTLGLAWRGPVVADVVFGFLLSGLSIGLLFGGLWGLGWIELSAWAWEGQASAVIGRISLWVGIVFLVSWWEELVFRGYLLQNLQQGVGLVVAILLTTSIFAGVHLVNPNATIWSALGIFCIGFTRVYGWLRTGQLWLSIGLHAGWNFFQGPVFGFAVSGRNTFSLLPTTATGPDWATGGAFGPEAGAVVFPVVVFLLGGLYLWTRTRTGVTQTADSAP